MLSSYRITLVSCLVIHFQVFNSLSLMILNQPAFLCCNIIFGLSYLLYPFCGWITEVYVCNFRMIRWSFVIMLISIILAAIPASNEIKQHGAGSMTVLGITTGSLSIIVFTAGLSMYEANAIQFGMDQMMEASSEQLSSFIHWYFWCAHVGPLLSSYILMGSWMTSIKVKESNNIHTSAPLYFEEITVTFIIISVIVAGVQAFITLIGFVFITCTKRCLTFDQISRNSLKIIYKVLIYSYHHKYPERRSAFTYWENDIPSRIDLGKDKYGGPFTYEQVEDVKCFFRLLLLIVSLFGYHLLGNGYSLATYIICNFGCPETERLLLILGNSQHIPFIVILICIPILECVRKYSPYLYFYLPNLLTRKLIGLVIALLIQALTIIIYTLPMQQTQQPVCSYLQTFSGHTVLQICLQTNSEINNTWSELATTNDNLSVMVYISIILLALQGLTYVLIFMTTLEFICAQSPNSMKGLLIGIWYSMLAIKFFLINNLDIHPLLLAPISWSVYNGIKGFGIFLSIVLFWLVTKHYDYRKRNEIVNEQAIIEEIHERELLLNESMESYEEENN